MPTRSTPIPPGTDPAQQNSIINKNFGELDAFMTAPLFYDVNGVPSISIGVQQDKTSRIRIAKPGKDVTTATDGDLAFNSAQNVFKIVTTGTLVVHYNASAGQAEGVVAHSLGYVPAALVYLYDGSIYQPTPLAISSTAGLAITLYDWYASTTTITFRITKNNVAGSGYASASDTTFKYYLLQETAN